jgi:hypothetical protein
MRNATRIDVYRRDDGSIVGQYEACDRMSVADIESCRNDMLDAVDDEGEHEYTATFSPEIIKVNGVGDVAMLEILLTSPTLTGIDDRDRTPGGPGADELRSIRRGWQT